MSENQTGLGGLFSKIAKISSELGAVEKDAQHQQKYMYHSADAVMGALNPLLTKYNIIIIPNTVGTPQVVTGADGLTRWVIDYEFVIACGDTGANFTAHWASEGVMSVGKDEKGTPKADDKSMGKTHTYALKYWLIHLFKISTKDTADLDQNDQSEGGKSAQKPAAQKTQAPANVSQLPQAVDDRVTPWTEQQADRFSKAWQKEGYKSAEILEVLGIKRMGEWKKSLWDANEVMNKAMAQGF
jgi:hypothetical protein